MNVECAFSPCPNDTFAFAAWVQGRIASPITLQPTLADIEKLNSFAKAQKYPLIKVSAFCLGNITQNYALLPTGAAIGFHSGPKLIAERSFSLDEIPNTVIAVPGKETTANLLLKLFFPNPKKILYLPYNEIIPAIQQKKCDAGVIIHESRFTFEQAGMMELADLGDQYLKKTGLPLPLGVVVAKRSLGKDLHTQLSKSLQASIAYARANPDTIAPYVLEHAQEKDPNIIAKHIELYVTKETEAISEQGVASIRSLFQLAIEKKELPKTALDFL